MHDCQQFLGGGARRQRRPEGIYAEGPKTADCGEWGQQQEMESVVRFL